MAAAGTLEKITFGRGEGNDFWPANIRSEGGLCRSFDLMHHGEARVKDRMAFSTVPK